MKKSVLSKQWLVILFALSLLPACGSEKETQQKVRTLGKVEQAENLLSRHLPGYEYRDPLNLDLAMRIEGASAEYSVVSEPHGKFPGRTATAFRILLSNLEGRQITLLGGGEISIGTASLLSIESGDAASYLVSAKCLDRDCVRLMVVLHEAEKGATDDDPTLVRRAAMIFYRFKATDEKKKEDVFVLGFGAPTRGNDIMSGTRMSAEEAEDLRKNAPSKNSSQPPSESTPVPSEDVKNETTEPVAQKLQAPANQNQLINADEELVKVWGK